MSDFKPDVPLNLPVLTEVVESKGAGTQTRVGARDAPAVAQAAMRPTPSPAQGDLKASVHAPLLKPAVMAKADVAALEPLQAGQALPAWALGTKVAPAVGSTSPPAPPAPPVQPVTTMPTPNTSAIAASTAGASASPSTAGAPAVSRPSPPRELPTLTDAIPQSIASTVKPSVLGPQAHAQAQALAPAHARSPAQSPDQSPDQSSALTTNGATGAVEQATRAIQVPPASASGACGASSAAQSITPAVEAQIAQRVMQDLQRQMDSMLAYRLRDVVGPVLDKHMQAVVSQLGDELTRTMRDVVARSVSQELAKWRQRGGDGGTGA